MPRPVFRVCAAASLGLAGMMLAACDSATSEVEDLLGTWELRGDNEYYVRIDSSRMTIYDYRDDAVDQGDPCFVVSSGGLKRLGGSVYQLGSGSDVLVVEMTRKGGTLTLNFGYIEAQYSASTRSTFTPVCTAPAT